MLSELLLGLPFLISCSVVESKRWPLLKRLDNLGQEKLNWLIHFVLPLNYQKKKEVEMEKSSILILKALLDHKESLKSPRDMG